MVWGAAIGGAMKIGGAIMGGIARRKAARQQSRILRQQKAENQAWYDRRYNEDSTQRADAQRSMQLMRDAMQQRYNRSAASGAVTGATDESLAAEKAAAVNAMGNTVSDIVVQGDARKDAIEQQYMANKNAIAQQEMALAGRQGQQTAAAAEGIANAASSFSSIDGLFGEKK